ncbi:neuferricin homolog [Culex quinquefasciatus]|uniref:neuferricin homolog n=1 Tax=Culex quinquefasciatus TaxID=7176 RepID=UPI0018E2D7B3|nr:neuferricin homolog [Culex quinquefasciatus]
MVLSYVAPYLRHIVVIGMAVVLFAVLSREPGSEPGREASEVITAEGVLTERELAQYDGTEGSKGLYLVILGHVYDVQSGAKHYGPGESYNMFVGHDASRSFVSGDFEQYTPEMSDVSALTDAEIRGIVKWKSFYDETYPYVGKLAGRYFDARGEPTEYSRVVEQRVARAEAEEEAAAVRGEELPTCNVEWKQESGTRVWCTSRSGNGVERGWVGRPRRYAETSEKRPLCVCVREGGDTEQLVPFDGCDPASDSCFVKEEEK